MKRRTFHAVFGVILTVGVLLTSSSIAAADSLSIAPLEYKATLQKDTATKGHVDIVNPSAEITTIALHVAAFRQINNQGGLQFYDNPLIDSGVKLDLTQVTLGPHEGARIYFMLYADKLPSGDVFAAILASTTANSTLVATLPSAQVGTLVLLENGTAPAHHAVVQQLNAPWLQLGSGLRLQTIITNTDPANGQALGFSPDVHVTTWPYGAKTATGPLLFSGHSRVVDYTQPGSYFGPVLLKVTTQQSTKATLIFAMTGYWQWLAPLIVIILVFLAIFGWRLRRKKHQQNPLKKQR